VNNLISSKAKLRQQAHSAAHSTPGLPTIANLNSAAVTRCVLECCMQQLLQNEFVLRRTRMAQCATAARASAEHPPIGHGLTVPFTLPNPAPIPQSALLTPTPGPVVVYP
jgi:hypothetical protein